MDTFLYCVDRILDGLDVVAVCVDTIFENFINNTLAITLTIIAGLGLVLTGIIMLVLSHPSFNMTSGRADNIEQVFMVGANHFTTIQKTNEKFILIKNYKSKDIRFETDVENDKPMWVEYVGYQKDGQYVYYRNVIFHIHSYKDINGSEQFRLACQKMASP